MTGGEPDPGFRYWAFISYSHTDTAWARWLHKSLETYRVPSRLIGMPIAAGRVPARLSPIFRDRDELPTATDLGHTIEEALRQSWCLIVICSRASAQSRWVNEEVLAFQRLGRAGRIHCLIVDGAPDAVGSPCYPPALIDVASGAHAPIAADARVDGDGKTNAKLKLIAGMLGVGFDKLVQREQQRRHRSMFVTTMASLLVVVALSVFSIITINSRRDADAQRRHAEGLVEFMLGDLRQKLEPDGKLATLDAVGKEALAYYAAQNPESLDADALARRARALQQIGEVYNLRGRLDDALDVFKQAEQSTAELLAREPENATRIFDHSQSAFWVGSIAYRRGDFGVAEAAFTKYKMYAEKLVSIAPDNKDWRQELGYADANLGILLHDRGRYVEATSHFEGSLEVALAQHRLAPNDASRANAVAQARAWLADNFYEQGLYAEAANQRQEEITLYDQMLASRPNENAAKVGLLVAERALGRIASATDNMPLALVLHRRASKHADELMALDPDNTDWASSAVAAYIDLGEASADNSDWETTVAQLRKAQPITTSLVEAEPSVISWQLTFARYLLLQARMQASENDNLSALRTVLLAVHKMDMLPPSDASQARAAGLHSRALLMSSDLSAAQGAESDSRSFRLRAAEVLWAQRDRIGPADVRVLVKVLREIGRSADAETISEKIAAVRGSAPSPPE